MGHRKEYSYIRQALGWPGSTKCASVLESLETRPSSQLWVHGTRGAAVFGRVGWGSRGGMHCLAAGAASLPCPHFRPHLSGLAGSPLEAVSSSFVRYCVIMDISLMTAAV